MGAGKYRKRALPVEAIQLDAGNGDEVAAWCSGERDGDVVLVPTMRGQLPAWPGDWIVKGTQQEFYPITDAVFRQVCEPAGERL